MKGPLQDFQTFQAAQINEVNKVPKRNHWMSELTHNGKKSYKIMLCIALGRSLKPLLEWSSSPKLPLPRDQARLIRSVIYRVEILRHNRDFRIYSSGMVFITV
jgi:hypothetical protein